MMDFFVVTIDSLDSYRAIEKFCKKGVAPCRLISQLSGMKSLKWIALSLTALISLLTVSCGSLPERPKQVGPTSSEGDIPWNRPRPGEGAGLLGGLGQR